MSDTVIKIENLSKRYIIGHETGAPYMTLRDTLTDVGKKLNPVRWLGKDTGDKSSKEEFWALKDINLEIKQGEKIGIIGRNGAGKSTLLKILSRITEPTTGKVQIKGRVASLLEVGTGFHPELSGRENIFLNGAILGMRKEEIKRKFDEIVDFSGVEKFLDTPVKRYSSGMYVRLAFAVAAHLEPEILLIDEVLAVGDAEFQKKCLGKMDDVAKQGRTVLFVSHNMDAIKGLCDNGILFFEGKVKLSGSILDVVDHYSLMFQSKKANLLHRYNIGSNFVEISDVKMEKVNIRYNHPIIIFVSTISKKTIVKATFTVTIKNENDNVVGLSYSFDCFELPKDLEKLLKIEIPPFNLAPGNYILNITIGEGNNEQGCKVYDGYFNILKFSIFGDWSKNGSLIGWRKSWGNIVINNMIISDLTR